MLCIVITGFIQTLHKIASRILINHLYYLSFCRCVARRFHPFSLYQKALIANAASSALRLHQRLPRVQLSRDYFSRLLLEDSAHYLLYSVMFLYSTPMTGGRAVATGVRRVVWSLWCSCVRVRCVVRAHVCCVCTAHMTCVALRICVVRTSYCVCAYSAAHPTRYRAFAVNFISC